ncbi:MAG: hydroxymethylglutaryl-CoA lyase [Nitrospirae bacterium]|nr:hydroxymethylglutaryl-CoA lyase [Nitrospirota bacterium]
MSEETQSTIIRITEVGPRDGLQNERTQVSLETKVNFINALSATGVSEIEVGAFVSPKAVPQMKDTDEVFRQINRSKGVTYTALVPNEQGLERALAAGVDKIAVFTAASNTFNQHNIHATIAESIARLRPVVSRAKQTGLKVRGYISTVVVCPYEGRIAPEAVMMVMRQLQDIGVEEIALGETLGKASPHDMRALLETVCAEWPPARLGLHLHDTYRLAIANALMAWEQFGITHFDGSAGGLGGCPYAPGAPGNVATEDLVRAFKAQNAHMAVNEKQVVEAFGMIAKELGRSLSPTFSASPYSRYDTTGVGSSFAEFSGKGS